MSKVLPCVLRKKAQGNILGTIDVDLFIRYEQ